MQQTACHECGVLVALPDHLSSSQYRCPRCDALLHRRGQPFSHIIVMAVSTLLLFIPLTFLPILSLEIMGMQSSATLFEALWHLVTDGYPVIAVLSIVTALVLPVSLMVLLLLILVPLRMGYRPNYVARYYRAYEHAREWGMVEVYLISVAVAIIKLSDMAALNVGPGLVIFIFFAMSFYITTVWFNPDDIWERDVVCD
jgi:paraquat-inducible protein A